MKKNKIFLTIWVLLAVYLLICAAGDGRISTAIESLLCGFMIALNLSNIVDLEEKTVGKK